MMTSAENPLQPVLDQQGVVVLDGGLATELERGGAVLDSALWSAKLLLDDADALTTVHGSFLDAGADCIATATYQASFEGFERMGLSRQEAKRTMLESVLLAARAVDDFWSAAENREARMRPLVAASLGPYGAFLADGSEYHGRYGVGRGVLHGFHRDRLAVMATSVADLIALETIPSLPEAEVLLDILSDIPGVWSWLSFSCRDGTRLSDGSPIREAAAACAAAERIAAVGVNCTAPRYVDELISEIRAVTDLPIAVYPNSGEVYDAAAKTWSDGRDESANWGEAAAGWVEAGARLVGGCCRVSASDISAVRGHVVSPGSAET